MTRSLPRKTLYEWAFAPTDVASLACFRVAFGALMAWEVYRYFSYGWIKAYYIRPSFHFKYYGFGWVNPWPGDGMYVHFYALGLLALCIMLGLWYRTATTLFFLGFTYVFLLDQAYYLNHFYLISLLAFLLIFVPAQRGFSLDASRRGVKWDATVPAWALWLLRAQVGIPYFYGGLAKLNADWLRGEPIRQWLSERAGLPLIGGFVTREWMVGLFGYGGLAFDLGIVPLLLWRRTRPWAFVLTLAFHATNAVVFRIGVFPWMMMAAATLFFPPDWPRRVGLLGPAKGSAVSPEPPPGRRRMVLAAAGAYFAMQLLVPLRHLAYPGDVNWTEEGHRFSWRMKLRDKDARAAFYVRADGPGEPWRVVDPRDRLTRRQAAKMAARPDMVLQFAHALAAGEGGPGRVEVRARVEASLNDRPTQLLVDPAVNLAAEERSLRTARWIVPLGESLAASEGPLGDPLAASEGPPGDP